MWTRFSNGSLGPSRRRILTGSVFATAFWLQALPFQAQAQNQDIEFNPNELDQVTQQVLQDSFLQLRFAALALEGKDETGQALNGLVRAMLARQEIQDAMDELQRIEDDIWYARSAAAISRHFYRVEKNKAAALEWLRRAFERVRTVENPRDGGEIMRVLARRLAQLGDLENAIKSAKLIPDRAARVGALRSAASAAVLDEDVTASDRQAAAAVLREAYAEARDMPDAGQETNRVLTEIGLAQLRADATEDALATFALTRQRIAEGSSRNRNAAFAELAAAMVEGGDMLSAMEVVRQIPEGAPRSIALGSVARAMASSRSIDAAVPLFTLAVEQAEVVENLEQRYAAFSHLVTEQARVGRLADAFTTAGLIQDRVTQARALVGMGRELIANKRFDEAQLLAEQFIPFIGMRAGLFAAVARHRGEQGDATEASTLLSRALDPTGFDPAPEFLPEAIDAVLAAQIDVGEERADDSIFSRARDLVDSIPGDAEQVRALVQVAIAEARRGLGAQSRKSISAAYRTAFENRNEPGFDEALQDISLAQIAAGDILSSFDTAARIRAPDDPADVRRAPDGSFLTPRFRALTRVAAAAARIGETDLAIRAANRMEYPPARSAGLAAVAVALASPESDLLDIIGEAAKSDIEDLGDEQQMDGRGG